MAKFKTPKGVEAASENQVDCRVLFVDKEGRLSVMESTDGELFVVCNSKLRDFKTKDLTVGQLVALTRSKSADMDGFRVATSVSTLPHSGTVTEAASFVGTIDNKVAFSDKSVESGASPISLKHKNVRYSLLAGNNRFADRVRLDE